MKVKRHLLIIVPSIISYKAFLSDLCSYLTQHNWEVTVVCDMNGQAQPEQATRFIHCDFPRGFSIKGYIHAVKALRAIVSELKPSLIHVHFSVAALFTALAKQKHWPPMLATIQGVIFTASSGSKATLYRFAELFSFKKYNQVWVLTPDDFRALKEANIAVHCQESEGFGCRSDIFDPSNFDENFRSQKKAELGIEKEDVVLIFVGRLVDFKGIHIAYRAFQNSKVRLANPPVKFIVVGDFDPLHDSGLTQQEKQDLENDASILSTGHIGNVEQYLAVSDINIFPSIREGMPVNLMESLSMGVPVITFDSRGCRDVVENQVTGFVLPERTPEAFSNAIDQLATNAALRNEFKNNALAQREKFSRELYIKEQISIYENIINKIRK